MIQLFFLKFKESTISILTIALLLTCAGLIILKSISSGLESNYFQQSFYKQLLFLIPAFFARQNTVTPVKIASFCVLINFLLNILKIYFQLNQLKPLNPNQN
mgnify:CR=1 FL=1